MKTKRLVLTVLRTTVMLHVDLTAAFVSALMTQFDSTVLTDFVCTLVQKWRRIVSFKPHISFGKKIDARDKQSFLLFLFPDLQTLPTSPLSLRLLLL
jgi:hypothetical protein